MSEQAKTLTDEQKAASLLADSIAQSPVEVLVVGIKENGETFVLSTPTLEPAGIVIRANLLAASIMAGR